VTFKIGVSSGIFGIAKERGHEEAMQYAGIPRKAMYAITKGVNFVQVDLESISEFIDPGLVEGVKNVKKLGIEFGLHSETPAFGQREFPHLDSAIDVDYRRGHERLWIILEGAKKVEAKYVLVHSSESTPFIFLSRELQPTDLVDVWGRPLDKFIEEENRNDNWVKKWLIDPHQGYIWVDIIQDTLEGYVERAVKDRLLELRQVRRYVSPKGEVVEEKASFTENQIQEISQETRERVIEYWYDYLIRQIKSRSLHYGPERTAYYIIAKWMERENDPLWNNIINVTVNYYVKKYNKENNKNLSIEQWLDLQKIKKSPEGNWTIENQKFREFYQLWVPAVSAKYVWGHFMQEECPGGGPYLNMDPKTILPKKKILFLFETPMAGHGMEDLLRFPQPAQMYYLIKEIKSPYVGIAVDLEHLLMDGIDPDIAIDILPEDGGKFVRVIHTGWPSPLGPAHIPIPIGSEQHLYLYRMYWQLRQKGMGKDPNNPVYLIFERGGGEDPIKQSVLSLRLIVKFLLNDVPPNRLPLEFFGIEAGQVASLERQWAIIEEHGRDPLKGLLIVPEETYGQISRTAIEKGKRPEEYKKEELRG